MTKGEQDELLRTVNRLVLIVTRVNSEMTRLSDRVDARLGAVEPA
jgi:hypothetical protein